MSPLRNPISQSSHLWKSPIYGLERLGHTSCSPFWDSSSLSLGPGSCSRQTLFSVLKQTLYPVWWNMSIIPAFERLRHEDCHMSAACLGYTERFPSTHSVPLCSTGYVNPTIWPSSQAYVCEASGTVVNLAAPSPVNLPTVSLFQRFK